MKYFLIETDEKNKNPYNINKNHALDIRYLTREHVHRLPIWNVVEMDFPPEGFFPDMICSPCLLLSELCVKTVTMYDPGIIYKGIKLWDRKSGVNVTYFLTVLNEVDCISDKTQYNSIRNRIVKLVLDADKIGSKVFFKIKGFERNCIAGRLDFVESMLRRGVRGITLEEVEVC